MSFFTAYLFDPCINAVQRVAMPDDEAFPAAAAELVGAPRLDSFYLTPDTLAFIEPGGARRDGAALWVVRTSRALPYAGRAVLTGYAGHRRHTTPPESPARLAAMLHVLGRAAPPAAPSLILPFRGRAS